MTQQKETFDIPLLDSTFFRIKIDRQIEKIGNQQALSPVNLFCSLQDIESLNNENIRLINLLLLPCYNDLEAVARLVQTEEEKNRVQQIINELAKETLRGNLTAYWWLPLGSVSFASIDEVSRGEEEKLYVNVLASSDPRQV